jgi:hypothetical protein
MVGERQFHQEIFQHGKPDLQPKEGHMVLPALGGGVNFFER